jgi:hypothetical protein
MFQEIASMLLMPLNAVPCMCAPVVHFEIGSYPTDLELGSLILGMGGFNLVWATGFSF